MGYGRLLPAPAPASVLPSSIFHLRFKLM